MSSVPVLLLIFNRPDHTEVLINRLRKIKPKFIYVAADGARAGNENDKINVPITRSLIETIDWDCTITKLFRNENLGCGLAVSSAITWFFQHVEEGIILEDDCIPNESFFPFCEEMLNYYRYEEKVMHVSGNNFQLGQKRGEASYYFSTYPHIWGWATWRRAWNHYEFNLPNPKDIPVDKFRYHLLPIRGIKQAYEGKVNTWDYQWTYALYKMKGMAVIPQVNLVENIGFLSGTHIIKGAPFFYKKIHTGEINKILHVDKKQIIDFNAAADDFVNKLIFNKSLSTKFRTLLNELKFKN